MDLYILPVLNIDGYIYSWETVSSQNPKLVWNVDVYNVFNFRYSHSNYI